jgi:protease I
MFCQKNEKSNNRFQSMASKIAVVFAEDMYECLELHYPRLRLIEAGYDVKVVGPTPKGTTHKSKEGYWAVTNCVMDDLDPKTVDMVVVPGGFCTDRLRRFPNIVNFLKDAWNDGKGASVGFICHGGWLPISAGILRGRNVTCFFAVKDDLINAGAIYHADQKCVVDGRMVSAQTPEDLPAFMAALLALPPRA